MKVKLLQASHPAHDPHEVERHRALYEGGQRWHDLIDTWLPKAQVEPDELWVRRKALATYFNHAGPIVDFFGAYLFAEAPSVDGVTGSWLEDWLGDVDLQGTSLATFFREAFVEACQARRAWVWVNLPRRPEGLEPLSLADEERAGLLDAHLVLLPDVHSWGVDEAGRVSWVVSREVFERRASLEEEPRAVWRWTHITRTRIQRYEWTAKEGQARPLPEDEALLVEDVAHGFGELPVARLELPAGLWLMRKLHDPAVSALRARNDLDWGLHRGAHSLLAITGAWESAQPTLGPGYWLQLYRDQHGADEAKFIEPSGASLTILAEDLKARRDDLYRVAQQMALAADGQSTQMARSGESKKRDYQATEIVLAAYADLVRGFIADTVRLVARARRVEAAPTIKGLDGWQNESLDVFLAALAQATEAKQLSPTFRKLAARRQAERILGAEVDPEELQEIRDEIEASDPDAADRALFGLGASPSDTAPDAGSEG